MKYVLKIFHFFILIIVVTADYDHWEYYKKKYSNHFFVSKYFIKFGLIFWKDKYIDNDIIQNKNFEKERYTAFCNNVNKIKEHNEAHERGEFFYKKDVNHFSHFT